MSMWLSRRRREMGRANVHHHVAWVLAMYERKAAARPFPRELDVAPHQIVGHVILACVRYRLYGAYIESGRNLCRHDRRSYSRLFRQLHGESLTAYLRRQARKHGMRIRW